jgi:hypothetical protein
VENCAFFSEQNSVRRTKRSGVKEAALHRKIDQSGP